VHSDLHRRRFLTTGFFALSACYCRALALARLPELVGFFSYSREDDEAFKGSLSALHDAIQRDLGAQLGRTRRNFRVWRDEQAIAPGEMWESEIAKAVELAVFFIPIVTPHAVASKHCKFEFESFLTRERALGRNDLVFPIHYILVPELQDEAEWSDDPVLSIVAKRQYVDWRKYRYDPIDTPAFRQAIGGFCRKISETLRKPWLSPEERRRLEVEARERAEDEERARQEAETKRQAEEQERLRKEALAKKRAEEEARKREEAKRRAEDEERVRRRAEAKRQTAERERLRTEVLAKNQAGRPREMATIVTVRKRPAREEESQASTNVGPLTAAQERALKPGDSFKEGADCPAMTVVPAGRFLMGSPAGRGADNERPQHEVTIAKPFAVATFALTFDEWDACAAQGGCRRDVSDNRWGRGRRPVINVSWDDAQDYVKWLSSITGKQYRLLSEAEYEYAARAGSQTTYPWGDGIKLGGRAMANGRGCDSPWDNKQAAPVGSFEANRFGLYDMVGNVREWIEDCWNRSYQGAPADGSPWTRGDCRRRVVRGGSWVDLPDYLRSADRDSAAADLRDEVLGFRVARTLSP
jgi:formylglycine-generating enzyme required for sulfatase activity